MRRDDYAPAFRIGRYAFDNLAGVSAGQLLTPADEGESSVPSARGPTRYVGAAEPGVKGISAALDPAVEPRDDGNETDPGVEPLGDGDIVAAMPELPDITVYLEALERHVVGRELRDFVLRSPFLLRTAEPDPRAALGRRVAGLFRIGKRIGLEFDGGQAWVIHLMIAGRLRFGRGGACPRGRSTLACLVFESGVLQLTEAGSKRRASLHVFADRQHANRLDRGGLEVLDSDWRAFAERLRAERHTLKRSLTSPELFSGIGNAYSDEILHRARLSPFAQSAALSDDDVRRLQRAAVDVLSEFTGQLRAACGDGFPDKVTAFLDTMAVHGKYRQPCPDCGAPVQRIVYASNETNYCANCQTGGVLLKDRALSRLLRDDWPRSLDALE